MIDQSIFPYRLIDENNVCAANFADYHIALAIRDKYFSNYKIFKI